jgi:O-antigen/teichoic acid export membrane protein
MRGARDPSSALLLAQLAVAAAAFVANILASRALAPDGRGELALLLQIAYLSSLGLLLGTDRSVVAVFAGPHRGEAVHAVGHLLRRPVLVTLAVAAAAVAALPFAHRGSWWPLVVLVAAFAIVNAFVRSMRSVAIATGRHRDFVRFTVASQVLLLVTMTVLFAVGVEVRALWLAAYLVAGALPTALCFLRWVRADGMTRPPASQLDAARREGLALFAAAVADSGMLRLDRLLLPALFSTAALGIYAGVATMTELLAWPLIAYADARVGTWRVASDSGTLQVRNVLLLALAYVVVAGALLALVIPVLVVPLLGESYAPASRLVAPLVAAAAVYGLGQVLSSLLIARRRAAGASSAATIGFVVSALAYVALIPAHGAAGAAYASLAGYSAALAFAAAALVMTRRSGRTPRGQRS